ncbi:MAG: tetratricopeptide repeat protein [Verrucomicrobiota bacterium]
MFGRIFLSSVAATASLAASEPIKFDASVFKDPEFIKEFTGSYGALPEVEPKISEEESTLLIELGELLQTNEKAAMIRLEQSLTESSSAALYYQLGTFHFRSGEAASAEKHYEKAIAKWPKFRRAHKMMGWLRCREGKYKEAILPLRKAIELGEGGARTYGLLAQCYLQEGHSLPAEAAFRQAYLLDPENDRWRGFLLRTLMDNGRWADANALIEPLLEANPDDSDLWLSQANCFMGMDKADEAALNFEIVHRMGKLDGKTLGILGRIYMRQEKPYAALDAYQAALAKAPDVKTSLATAKILVSQGAYKEAETYLNQIKKQVKGLALADQLELKNLEAQAVRALGKREQSVRLLEEIVRTDPGNGEALVELGRYHGEASQLSEDEDIKSSHFAAARRYFESAMKVEGSEFYANLRFAQVHARRRDFDKAVMLLKRAVALKPERADVERFYRQIERAARVQKQREKKAATTSAS